MVKTAVKHAADGDEVGKHESDDLKRDDGVESDVGADIDER